jgi:eukaryotic translation initiation factor 2C
VLLYRLTLHQTHKLNHTYVRATLGVSYASPTYYADRLCERGRCYLREWYNPTSTKRKEFDNKKFDLQRDAQPKNKNNDATKPEKRNTKTAEDVEAEKRNREDIDEKMYNFAMDQIRPTWDPVTDPSVAPGQLDTFQRTMYWM